MLNQRESYSRDDMEAACCLWEAMLEFSRNDSLTPEFRVAFEQHGSVAMRLMAIELAKACDKAWNDLPDEAKDVSFDWDFCPEFIASLDWSQWPPLPSQSPINT